VAAGWLHMQDVLHHNRQRIDGLAHIRDTAIQMDFDIVWN